MELIKKVLLKEQYRKAKSKAPVEVLIEELQIVLSKTWDEQARKAVINSLEHLRMAGDLGGSVTKEEIRLIKQTIGDKLGIGFQQAVSDPVIEVSDQGFEQGGREAVRGSGARFGWNLKDRFAMRAINDGSLYWIGQYYPDFLQGFVNNSLNKYFRGGYSRRDIMLDLEVAFRDKFSKSDSYWRLFADNTVSRSREIGRVRSYVKNDIVKIRVVAVLDTRTTEVCRKLHGHVISVTYLNDQIDRYIKASGSGNKTKVKNAWKWTKDKTAKKWKSNRDINNAIKKGNIASPPYHANCRTVTVPEYVARGGTKVLTDADKRKLGREQEKPKRKKKLYDRQSTVSDAQKYGMDNNFADIVDFGKLDNDIANLMNQEIAFHLSRYPELRNNLSFYGSGQARNRVLWQRTYDDYIKRGYGDSIARDFADGKKSKSRMKSGVYAEASPPTRLDSGIAINEKWGSNPTKMDNQLKRDADTNFHPEGTDSIKAVIDHELGHILDYTLKISSDEAIVKMFNDFLSLGSTRASNELSRYAYRKGIQEFIAESWAEYLNNPRPRKIANAVGERIEEIYKIHRAFRS